MFEQFSGVLLQVVFRACCGPLARRDERGDVPGWVLITVMTAGLVGAIWAIAGPQLQGMLSDALSSVRG